MRTCRLLRKAMLAEGPTTVAARIGCAPSELARVVHGDIVGASEPGTEFNSVPRDFERTRPSLSAT